MVLANHISPSPLHFFKFSKLTIPTCNLSTDHNRWLFTLSSLNLPECVDPTMPRLSPQRKNNLLALTLNIFTWPKNFVFVQILFSSACMCLSVCVWVFTSIISKSYWPILIKLGRMTYNDRIQVPFEDGMNRSGRTHTSPIWNIEIAISYTVLGQTP